MFVFYFGILADITPPVALAAFAATGISGGEPIRTGVNATKLAIAAFIIPYMFVLQPQLLMIDSNFFEIALAFVTAFVGMIAIGGCMIGFWYRKLNWIERLLSLASGLMLIYPEGYTDLFGFILFVILVAWQIFTMKRNTPQQTSA